MRGQHARSYATKDGRHFGNTSAATSSPVVHAIAARAVQRDAPLTGRRATSFRRTRNADQQPHTRDDTLPLFSNDHGEPCMALRDMQKSLEAAAKAAGHDNHE